MAHLVEKKCGFCLRTNTNIIESKQLPCGHVHCLSCLSEALTLTHFVQCPDCTQVVGVTLTKLPSGIGADKPQHYCDICLERKDCNTTAVSYCTHDSCKKLFCDKHAQFHNEVMLHHEIINIAEYERHPVTYQTRFCSQHPERELTCMGCKACLQPLCFDCIDDQSSCAGMAHQVVTIKKLSKTTRNKINRLKTRCSNRREKLLLFCEDLNRIISSYDEETEKMVEQIHHAKCAQLQSITAKYTCLEKNLRTGRDGRKKDLAAFKDLTVDPQLIELEKSIKVLAALALQCHEGNVISSHNESKQLLEPLLSSALPSLTIATPTVKLDSAGKCRSIELTLVPSNTPLTVKPSDSISATCNNTCANIDSAPQYAASHLTEPVATPSSYCVENIAVKGHAPDIEPELACCSMSDDRSMSGDSSMTDNGSMSKSSTTLLSAELRRLNMDTMLQHKPVLTYNREELLQHKPGLGYVCPFNLVEVGLVLDIPTTIKKKKNRKKKTANSVNLLVLDADTKCEA
ncbi:uncharacterized protein [Watersipora subatra]|uniref:uncharacterized protein n=1 Tax=Watersipora subatra TaxID=2589382 RepID=UPI00355B64E9